MLIILSSEHGFHLNVLVTALVLPHVPRVLQAVCGGYDAAPLISPSAPDGANLIAEA